MQQKIFSLHSLPKIAAREKKRVGRGYGSGKGGHTSGRGQKGQKSRRTIPWSFEGGALPLSRRLPFMRGKGRLHSLKEKRVILNIGDFEDVKDGTVVDIEFLKKEGYVDPSQAIVRGVKILGRGKLTKKLTISGLIVSMPAKAKIEKAGGEIQGKKEEGKGIKEEKIQAKETVKTTKVVQMDEMDAKVKKIEKVKMVKKVEEKKNKGSSEKKIAKKSMAKTSKKITEKTTPKKKNVKKTSK